MNSDKKKERQDMFASFYLKDDYYIRLYWAYFKAFFALELCIYKCIYKTYLKFHHVSPPSSLLKTINETITGLGIEEMGVHSLIAINLICKQTKNQRIYQSNE